MPAKAQVTRSIHPLHFEDLDPHRFEDLVRQLAYDFRDWQSLEATGRSGSDDGIDIRAWEKTWIESNRDEEDSEVEGQHAIEGNLWMFQCKREKSLGPSRVKQIIDDGVSHTATPYGYVLVAPANFSKKSYDIFREGLRKKGVKEFHIWGRAELEDMLSMPKNDHILFTFFGISLATKTRTRTQDIKFRVNNKNKLLRICGVDHPQTEFHKSVLVRDLNDTKYPWKDECEDFEHAPPWIELVANAFHPQGLYVNVHNFYGFFDEKKKEFDFVREVDLVNRQSILQEDHKEFAEKSRRVRDFWRHLPRKNQAFMIADGIILFDDILLIDERGDAFYEFPHIYVDFRYDSSPLGIYLEKVLTVGGSIELGKQFERKTIFPKNIPEIQKGIVHGDKEISLAAVTFERSLEAVAFGRSNMHGASAGTLFDIEGKFEFLRERDAIPISSVVKNDRKSFIEITHRYSTNVRDYLRLHPDPSAKQAIEKQVGRKVANKDSLEVLEFQTVWEWELTS